MSVKKWAEIGQQWPTFSFEVVLLAIGMLIINTKSSFVCENSLLFFLGGFALFFNEEKV